MIQANNQQYFSQLPTEIDIKEITQSFKEFIASINFSIRKYTHQFKIANKQTPPPYIPNPNKHHNKRHITIARFIRQSKSNKIKSKGRSKKEERTATPSSVKSIGDWNQAL